jgi:hypothetical protein
MIGEKKVTPSMKPAGRTATPRMSPAALGWRGTTSRALDRRLGDRGEMARQFRCSRAAVSGAEHSLPQARRAGAGLAWRARQAAAGGEPAPDRPLPRMGAPAPGSVPARWHSPTLAVLGDAEDLAGG